MKRFSYLLLAFAICASSVCSFAAVKLPKLISNGMVVQRGEPVKLWGWADPGETVAVAAKSLVKKPKYKASATAVADADGKWEVELPAMPAGGPYALTIGDVTVSDVLSGDVLLCSGQSNMQLPVNRVTDMFADEIAAYENPQIRHFTVPNVVEFHKPAEDLPYGDWRALTQDNVMQFSALAYFLAKELYARNGGVPVGIVNSSWGGTPIEAWISEDCLASFPMAIAEKRIYEDDGYRQRIKQLESENYARWDRNLYALDPGKQAKVQWSADGLDVSDWADVDMLSKEWASDGLNPANGSHWWRKSVNLPASAAGKEAVLRMGCIVDADSVYVNGQFVGTISYQYPPRIYKVPAGLLREGENNITVRMLSQNGFPHFVAEKPYKLICDGAEYSLEGTWKYRRGAVMPHGPGMEFWCYKPTVLYNAMIHPLANCKFAAAVWYQGESNVDRRNQYAQLLQTMIANWRHDLDDAELPFYIVELAGFLSPDDTVGQASWAQMRAQQAKAAEATEGATLIHNSDLGEWNDIHPLDKKTLARRIADAMLGEKK
mgnify:FL=1